ncbi:MAG: flavin reductase family protein [Bacteroidetes bacterium]|jgi:flavin reductase (DIM6/NTAB) family NADH-FMN oxidoreductase RutF|nr:flavin reductase family protein [Bacteroidota bacterium]
MPDISLKTIQPKILYFGTPVALITTIDQQGHPNIGPMSSVWALGYKLVLGMGCDGKTFSNLIAQKECVVNIPSINLQQNIESIAHLTGVNPVPESKKVLYRYEPDKFTTGGFSAIDSQIVKPPAIKDCPIQLEAILEQHSIIDFDADGKPDVAAVTVKVVNVRVHENIVVGNNHIDPQKWSPLIYNFRHYFGLGEALGKNFKAEI